MTHPYPANTLGRCARWLARLWQDRSAVAYLEFAYAFPAVSLMGLYGVEATNLALTNMRISQIALTVADNSSRVGQDSSLSLVQFRESDVNDSFMAAKLQAGKLNLTTQGRLILSSLQQNEDGGQWIAWQRCVGLKHYDSTYGEEGDGETGTSFPGMGQPGQELKAPAGNAVMFVEVTYDYEPIVSSTLFGQPRLHYTASFVVRDQRDLTQIYNPSPAAAVANCNQYTL